MYRNGIVLVTIMRIGLARFATEKYTACTRSLNKKFVHLTNYSVNRFSEKYVENNLEELVSLPFIRIGLRVLDARKREQMGSFNASGKIRANENLLSRCFLSDQGHSHKSVDSD